MMNYQYKPSRASSRTRISKVWQLPMAFLLATIVAVKAGDYTYTTNFDNTLTIAKYTGSGGSVVIPSAIDGRTVTIIGYNAFDGSSSTPNFSLTSVTVPDSVTDIKDLVFQYCVNLTSVTIPNSVISIGDSAFRNCSSLTSVTIPDNVTSIRYATPVDSWQDVTEGKTKKGMVDS